MAFYSLTNNTKQPDNGDDDQREPSSTNIASANIASENIIAYISNYMMAKNDIKLQS